MGLLDLTAVAAQRIYLALNSRILLSRDSGAFTSSEISILLNRPQLSRFADRTFCGT
jgi:hypothetical protein